MLDGFNFERLLTDRGYSAEDFIDYLLARAIEAVIPSYQRAKVLRDYDVWPYRERSLVECFIKEISIFAVSFPALRSWIARISVSCTSSQL